MPGVPSAKGCDACRKSKKKCDQAKPQCSRCLRLKARCVGAGQQRYTFINQVDRKSTAKPILRTKYAYRQPEAEGEKPSYENSTELALRDHSPNPNLPESYHGRLRLGTAYHLEPVLLVQPTNTKLNRKQVAFFDRFQNQLVCQLGSHSFDDFWFRTILRESTRDDCILKTILGIGALAQALETAPRHIALYKVPMWNHASNSSYLDAIGYFTDSLAKFRSRIHQGKAAPRTILLSTILFIIFELLQGNNDSEGKFIDNGIMVLKDKILYSAWPDKRSQIAALCDDEGVEDAEFILVRGLSSKWLLGPRSTQGDGDDTASMLRHTNGPKPPDHSKNQWTLFWRLWMQFLTVALRWYTTAQHQGKRANLKNDKLRLKQEQRDLLVRIDAWDLATQQKLREKSDMDDQGRRVLGQIRPGLRLIRLYIQGAFYEMDESNDNAGQIGHEILDLAESSFEAKPVVQVCIGEVFGSIQYISLALMRICRDSSVRRRGIYLCRKVMSGQAPWNVKEIVMGNLALISLEEAGRDKKGLIPLTARYDWIHSSWNDDYTLLSIVFRARAAKEDAHDEDLEERLMTLKPNDFGLI